MKSSKIYPSLTEVFYQTFAKLTKFNPSCVYPIQTVHYVPEYKHCLKQQTAHTFILYQNLAEDIKSFSLWTVLDCIIIVNNDFDVGYWYSLNIINCIISSKISICDIRSKQSKSFVNIHAQQN